MIYSKDYRFVSGESFNIEDTGPCEEFIKIYK